MFLSKFYRYYFFIIEIPLLIYIPKLMLTIIATYSENKSTKYNAKFCKCTQIMKFV